MVFYHAVQVWWSLQLLCLFASLPDNEVPIATEVGVDTACVDCQQPTIVTAKRWAPSPRTAGENTCPRPCNTPKREVKTIDGLQSLRFLALLQLIGYQVYRDTGLPFVDRFNQWGDSASSFFFVLSGFVLALNHFSPCGNCTSDSSYGSNFRLTSFLSRRWAKLYPLYLVTIIIGKEGKSKL